MSPVVVDNDTGQFTKIVPLVEYWREQFNANKDLLGINWICAYDERFNLDYPALFINPVPSSKEVHASRTWLYSHRIFFYVVHAKLLDDRVVRSQADIELAETIEDFLEIDKTLGDKVIFSYVDNKTPGALPPFVTKTEAVISTRLSWYATSEGRFEISGS